MSGGVIRYLRGRWGVSTKIESPRHRVRPTLDGLWLFTPKNSNLVASGPPSSRMSPSEIQ